MLCGEMRLSVYVIGTPCAVNGWTCAVSLARLSRVRRGRSARSVGSLSLGMLASYHKYCDLSTTNLRNAENSFSACHTSTKPPAAPVQSARARPPVPPWHDPTFAALRRVIFCANMTRGDGLHPDRRRRDQHRCCHYISISQLISTTHKRTGKHP